MRKQASLAVTVIALFAIAANWLNTSAKASLVPTAAPGAIFKVDYAPAPSDLVNIDGKSGYVVPVGKDLVITGWAVTGTIDLAIQINGKTAWKVKAMIGEADGRIETGIVAHANDAIALSTSFGLGGLASGYLVDQSPMTFTLRVPYVPRPSEMVSFDQSGYTVPAGKILVLTDWTSTKSNIQGIEVYRNGALAWHSANAATNGYGYGGGQFGGPIVFSPGDVVTLSNQECFVAGFIHRQ